MPANRLKLKPVEVLGRLQARLTKRIAALERVGIGDGFAMVISELKVELDYLKRAQKYLEE